ncbi:MAG: hypothetical protein ACYSSO_14170 [Planctomycetota bacterium]
MPKKRLRFAKPACRIKCSERDGCGSVSVMPRTRIFRKFVTSVRGESVYKPIDWTGFSKESKERWLADYQKLWHLPMPLPAGFPRPYPLPKRPWNWHYPPGRKRWPSISEGDYCCLTQKVLLSSSVSPTIVLGLP